MATPARRDRYITKACEACKSAKRRCLPSSSSSSSTQCKRCLELRLTCAVHVRADGRRRRPRQAKSNKPSTAAATAATATSIGRPGSYNFVLREMSGVAATGAEKSSASAVHDPRPTSALLLELDALLGQSGVDTLSRWADWQLGAAYPLLPSAKALQRQRVNTQAAADRQVLAMYDPALTVLETTQYLFAVRHADLADDIQVKTIERISCAILCRCASDLLLSAAPLSVDACLALQLLCLVNVHPNGKHEPPFALLSAASRTAYMAKRKWQQAERQASDGPTQRYTQALILWCSAYAWELSWLLGTAQGQAMYRAESYVGVVPGVEDVQQVRERVLAADGVDVVGVTTTTTTTKNARKEALLACLDRTMMVAIEAQAWIDVQASSSALRRDRHSDDAQLRCLSRIGSLMSTWQRGTDELHRRREACKARLPTCVTELYAVEVQMSNTILLGQVMRSHLDATFDIDSVDRFATLGERAALRNFVSVVLSSSARMGVTTNDTTPLRAAKTLLAELVGQLPDDGGGGEKRWPTWRVSDSIANLHDFPPLLSLGYLFEAGMLVLQAHAPHLSLSRSTLALEDSWALLAWATFGLVSSLLTADDDDDDDEDDESTAGDASDRRSLIVEQHCQHVEARMVLDLPFPLQSDQGNAQWNRT